MITELPEGFTVFYNLEDLRVEGGNKQRSLFDILFITLCSTVAGCETYTEVEQCARERHNWFRKFLKLENGIPSHDMIVRVLAALDSHSFQTSLHDWIEYLCLDLRGQGVHIDGKTLAQLRYGHQPPGPAHGECLVERIAGVPGAGRHGREVE